VAKLHIPRVAYSVTSQGLVSACTLLLSLALLYYSEARHYVAFLLFLNVVQLLNGLQNALFVSPVGVLVPRLPAAEVARTEQAAYRMTALVALAGLPFISYFLTRPPRLDPFSVAAGAVVFLATIMLLQREIARNACLVRSDLQVLVKFDLLYFSMAMLLAGIAVVLHELSFVIAVLAFALPAALTRLSRPRWPSARVVVPAHALTAFGPAFWTSVAEVTRWSVPGVLVTWLFSNGYWFVLERTQDTQTVASLGASRLLFAPVGLFIQGWLMQLRPLSVVMAHRGQAAELRRLVMRQSAAGAACVLLLAASAYALTSWYPQVLPLSMRAPDIPSYLLVWALYFVAFWYRSGVSTLLLTNASGFKTVFVANTVVCAVFYTLFFGGLGHIPLALSLASLIAGELIMIYLLNRHTHA